MITKDDVLKIAKLAHLQLTEADLPEVSKHLASIFEYFTDLNSVDVSNVEAMSHVQSGVNVFREDVVAPSLSIDDALGNTPDVSGRYIRVPIIIEGNTEH